MVDNVQLNNLANDSVSQNAFCSSTTPVFGTKSFQDMGTFLGRRLKAHFPKIAIAPIYPSNDAPDLPLSIDQTVFVGCGKV